MIPTEGAMGIVMPVAPFSLAEEIEWHYQMLIHTRRVPHPNVVFFDVRVGFHRRVKLGI